MIISYKDKSNMKSIVVFFYYGNKTFQYGVAEVYLRIMNTLDKNKYKVILLYSGKLESNIRNLDKDIEVIELKTSGLKKLLFPYLREVRRIKPDIVLSAMEHPNILSILVKILSWQHNYKLIISSHGVFSARLKYLWKGIQKFVIKTLVSFTYPMADRLICVSKYVCNDLNKYLKRNIKQNYIYNPIISKVRSDSIVREKKESYLVVTAARLTKGKYIHNLLDAFQYLDTNFKLLVLGDGEELNNLQALAKSLSLDDRVEFKGYVDNPEEYFEKAEIFVLASKFEGFGNVLVEAMSCGCQIVANNISGGPTEILDNGKYGFLYLEEDTIDMANKIQEAHTNPKQLDELITYANTFTYKRSAKQYENIFDELLKDRK